MYIYHNMLKLTLHMYMHMYPPRAGMIADRQVCITHYCQALYHCHHFVQVP